MMNAQALQQEAHRLDDLILAGKISEAELHRELAAFDHAEVPPEVEGLHVRLVQALQQTLGWRSGH